LAASHEPREAKIENGAGIIAAEKFTFRQRPMGGEFL
jgi:hypothetical protein